MATEILTNSGEPSVKMIEEIQDYSIIILDPGGNIVSWNRSALIFSGYEPQEIAGKNFTLFYTEEEKYAGLPDKLIKEALNNGRAVHEGSFLRKQGKKIWGNVVISPLLDENLKLIGFISVTRDLARQRGNEDQLRHYTQLLEKRNEELRKSEEQYHQMVAEVQDYAILMMDKDGYILNWNKGAEKIKGYKAEEIIGKNFRHFYTDKDRERKLPEKLLSVAGQSGRAMNEGWRVRKDGTTFWGSIVITAIHNQNNEIIGYTKVTRDLTEKKISDDNLKDYAHKLEEKSEELERFAYVASHDLKEPLRKVIAFGDLLQSNYGSQLDERANDYIQRMQNASLRMTNLIEDLLTLSRISRTEEIFEPIDLNLVIQDVLHDLDFTIAKKNAEITVSNLPKIKAKRSQMGQLFQNLILNALKFNDKPVPVVKISSRVIQNQRRNENFTSVLINIEDNGIGFEEKYLNKIFEIFQRLHGQAEYPGTGVGLAICKKIVEGHGGLLYARSVLGSGSVFTIELPVEDQP